MRHAYLILAHEKPEVLKELLKEIDDPRNDIFLHIDLKATFKASEFKTINANLFIITNRLDARWGDFSLVEAELLLLENALSTNVYSRYHLISGVDYPIKTQDYIHNFCLKYSDTEFIGFAQNVNKHEIQWRSQHYFLFSDSFKSSSLIKKILRRLFASLQSILRYKRSIGLEIKKGAQWWSITNDFAQYIFSKSDYIRRNFSHTYCPDEMVFQTICWNSPFRNRLFDINNEFNGCLRYIPWEKGILRPLVYSDYDKMNKSSAFFGRKFSLNSILEYKLWKSQS